MRRGRWIWRGYCSKWTSSRKVEEGRVRVRGWGGGSEDKRGKGESDVNIYMRDDVQKIKLMFERSMVMIITKK